MERQIGIVPYKAENQAMSLDNQCSFHLDKHAGRPNPTQAMESAQPVTLAFMVAIMHTDLIRQKQNPSRQHVKILCREKDEWIDATGTLATGTEHNWIGSHVLNRSGPQPRSRIPEEIYTDSKGERFSATETATICWHFADSYYVNEGKFRVMEGGGFDIILGRLFLDARGICEVNENALLSNHRKASKGVTYHLMIIYHYNNTRYVRR